MAEYTLIHGARQLLTLRGPSGPRRGPALRDLGIIPDGDVLLRDGVIHAVGPGRQIQNLGIARNAREIDASGRVVMPAFVDLEAALVHAHPSPRSFEKLLENHGNPDPEVFRDVLAEGAKGLRGLSSQSLRPRTAVVCDGIARHGTGTVEARAGYPLDDTAALKVLRVQSDLSNENLNVVSTLLVAPRPGDEPVQWVQYVCEDLLPTVRKRRLAAFADIEYDAEVLPVPLVYRILETASSLGYGVKVHTGFFSRTSAASLAVRAGVLTVSDLHQLAEDQIDALGASHVIAILKPGLALQAGDRYLAPARKLVDAGAAVAISSGYHPEFSPGYNLQLSLMLATRFYPLRPEEAINAATINAAHAIRAAASVGSIESGKQADLLIMDASDYRELVFYGGVNAVRTVIRCGKVVYKSGAKTLLST